MTSLRIALAQLNLTVGDIDGNTDRIVDVISNANGYSADIVVFPELAVTGYPPEDLLYKPQFIEDNILAIDRIRRSVSDITAVVGFVDRSDDGIYNSAALINRGEILDVYHKFCLPNYSVFDEMRYFKKGERCNTYGINGIRFGLSICEDIWHSDGPHLLHVQNEAALIININASPYSIGKAEVREKVLTERARDNGISIAYINMVGGQDELVFDGGSLIMDRTGGILCKGKQFEEEVIMFDINIDKNKIKKAVDDQTISIRTDGRDKVQIKGHDMPEKMSRHEEIYCALIMGTRDYVRKNGFKKVVIGLSGGIDSSLVACIAFDALGKDNVNLVFMPSRFTSVESREDSEKLAGNLGVKLINIPITSIFDVYLDAFEAIFKDQDSDITEENLQARIRGNILMALSNKFGWLVLTTGNKSEMSVGYATLYGDMAGGFAVIKDVSKMLVYELAKWRNKEEEVIPERVLWKEPTAELRDDQKDSDSLPPYPMLDPVLHAYIEQDLSFKEMLELDCDRECIEKVIGLVDRSEYKRRQAPPGVRITERAFGRDRRFPITNRYRSY
ncbi:MAG: NAD+ synthase [Nitrospirota bacterium]|nr:MAG: NAD+ synthase [Nitrospirota bacterium]